jgi:hypothetical protein
VDAGEGEEVSKEQRIVIFSDITGEEITGEFVTVKVPGHEDVHLTPDEATNLFDSVDDRALLEALADLDVDLTPVTHGEERF